MGDVLVVAGEYLQQVPPGDDADDPAAPDDRDGLDPTVEHEPARLGGVGVLVQRDHRPGHRLGGHPWEVGGWVSRWGQVGTRVGRQLEGDQVRLGDDADQLAVLHHRHGADAVGD